MNHLPYATTENRNRAALPLGELFLQPFGVEATSTHQWDLSPPVGFALTCGVCPQQWDLSRCRRGPMESQRRIRINDLPDPLIERTVSAIMG